MFRGKKYQDSVKLVEKSKFYDTNEAMDLITKTAKAKFDDCLLYTSPSPRDGLLSRMPSSA